MKIAKQRRSIGGFTIVELIAVIVLLAVAGVVVMSRFLGPSSFEISAAQDGLLTAIRSAQQTALGREDVTFEINQAGGDWVFVTKVGGTDIREIDIPADYVTLETGSAAEGSMDTCSMGADFDTPVDPDYFELQFDEKGNLSQFAFESGAPELVDDSFNGVRICVNDSDALSVCVSRAGYAYAGNCDA